MRPLKFVVKGSKGDEYVVTFEKKDQNVRVLCTCQAGQNRSNCKHRRALMDGDVTAVLSENVDEVREIKALLAGSDVEAAYARFREAEKIQKVAMLELSKAKKALARAMYR
jgi:hypothetical protein